MSPDNEPSKLVEVTRSFTRKVNLGNYESADFFCSAKEECLKVDAGLVSEELFDFCHREVMQNVEELLKARGRR